MATQQEFEQRMAEVVARTAERNQAARDQAERERAVRQREAMAYVDAAEALEFAEVYSGDYPGSGYEPEPDFGDEATAYFALLRAQGVPAENWLGQLDRETRTPELGPVAVSNPATGAELEVRARVCRAVLRMATTCRGGVRRRDPPLE